MRIPNFLSEMKTDNLFTFPIHLLNATYISNIYLGVAIVGVTLAPYSAVRNNPTTQDASRLPLVPSFVAWSATFAPVATPGGRI